MRIVVLVKQVPEVSELRLDPVSRRLCRDGVDAMMNPFDRRAMLEAHRLRAEVGGSIAALTMGPPQSEQILRECLGLGADRAVHLSDRAFAGADTLATARALARAVEKIGFDLLLAGRYSIDSETGQVGPEVAALLGKPFLGGVRRLDVRAVDGGWTAEAECEGDDGFSVVDGRLPLVVTCTDRWKTRVPRVLPDDEKAASAAVEVWSAEALGGRPDEYGEAGSPTWVEEVRPVASDRRGVRLAYADAPTRALAELRRELDRGESGAARVADAIAHDRPGDSAAPRIWALGERGPEGDVRPVTWELLSEADRLASALEGGTALFLLEPPMPQRRAVAPPALDVLAAAVGTWGGDELLVSDAPPEAQVEVLCRAIVEQRPRIVLAPATSLGRDVVPQVAARLGLGLTGDAVGVALDDEGRLQQLKPAFGGLVVAPILSRTRPEMATIRPGVIEPATPDAARPAAELTLLPPVPVGEPAVRVREFEAEVEAAEALLEEAPVVVCVGFGLGQAGVAKARALAHRLGGAVAGTRRVCDLKWLPRQVQVGISGRNVTPVVYLALGVRGSFNHMVGVRRAGTILAVNNDPDAEIFQSADLCIVGDAEAVLDDLLAAYGSE